MTNLKDLPPGTIWPHLLEAIEAEAHTYAMDYALSRDNAVKRGRETPELAALLVEKFVQGMVTAFNIAGLDSRVMHDIDQVVRVIDPNFDANRAARWAAHPAGLSKTAKSEGAAPLNATADASADDRLDLTAPDAFDALPEQAVQLLMEPVLSLVHTIGRTLQPRPQDAGAELGVTVPWEVLLVQDGQLVEPVRQGLTVRVRPELLGPDFHAFVVRVLGQPLVAQRMAQWAHPMHLEARGADIVLVNDVPPFVGPPAPKYTRARAIRLSELSADAVAASAGVPATDAPSDN